MKVLSRARAVASGWADRHLTKENGRRITQALVDSYSRAAGPRWASRCFKGLRQQGYEVPVPEPRRWGGRIAPLVVGLAVGLFVGASLGSTASELGRLRQVRESHAREERPVPAESAGQGPDDLLPAEVRRLIAGARKEIEGDGEREQEREEAAAEEEGRVREAGR